MTKFYSASTAGFYDSAINPAMPGDAVAVTDAQWQALLDGQAKGQMIQASANGTPVLMQRPAPPPLTPIQQIRALEQANDDNQRKLNRQAAIDTALTIACRAPAAAGMTRDQVNAAYYAGNLGYKTVVDLEAQCAALRKLIV